MSPIWTDSEWTFDLLKKVYDEIEKIAVEEMGYSLYPNQIDIIGSEQMLDAYSSIGLPVYYRHWSFGKRFVAEEKAYRAGRRGLAYEIVINSSPCINYLMEENTMTIQALVLAHAACGHNYFFKNNYMFKDWTDAEGILDYMIFAKDYVHSCEERYGMDVVEMFLDSAHALQSHGVNRYKRPTKISMEEERERQNEREEYLQSQVNTLYRLLPKDGNEALSAERFPEQPEENLLYFFEKHAPHLEPWQRELLRIVRKTSQYFYPQMHTQVLNEGFATWTHYKIMHRLHEKGLMTDGAYIEFLDNHSGVVWQGDWNDPHYSGLNPYKLGFEILRDVERMCVNPTDEDKRWFPDLHGKDPVEVIRDIADNYRDESFIRQFLSPKVIRDFRLFAVSDDKEDDFVVVEAIQNDSGYEIVRERLAEQYERSAMVPHIEVFDVNPYTRELTLQFTPHRNRFLSDPRNTLRHVWFIWGNDVVIKDNHGSVIDEYNESIHDKGE